MTVRPTIRLLPAHARRVRAGHPWVYSNELAMDEAARALPRGTVVRVQADDGGLLGCATFNPHSLIAARLLDADAEAAIDAGWLAARLARAAALRDRLVGRPFYRLVHAEADGLPGLVVDRFGPACVVQANTAGMDALLPAILEALQATVAPRTVVLRNDSGARGLEGLKPEVRVEGAAIEGPQAVEEGGLVFQADLLKGQKTGWFHDQRDNRAFLAGLAAGARVLDGYCHTGGFGLRALAAGAAHATLVDSSEGALALAARAAEGNGLAARAAFVKADVFTDFQTRLDKAERWDVVVADPPSFVKSKRDLASGTRGYRKLARMAAGLVEPGGFLLLASCSHNVPPDLFAEQVRRGLRDAGRTGRVLRTAGAAPDHPVHPWLPESAYLKCQVLQLD